MRYIVVILVVAMLFIVGVLTLSNRGSKSNSSPNAPKITKVTDEADKPATRVTWTEQGRLVDEDQRKAVRIIVTPTSRTIQLLSGYEERVDRSEDFSNTQTAFDTFIRALDQMNFGKERTVKQADERGMCPFGNRYIYNLDGDTSLRSWSDSCSTSDGTFGGSSSNTVDIRRLFQNQINDYTKFVSGTGL